MIENETYKFEILIICKDFYKCKDTPFVIDTLGQLSIYDKQIDGLIFTKINYPYIPGPNKGMLKWKPENLNSIDFLAIDNDFFNKNHDYCSEKPKCYVIELYVIKGHHLMLYDYLFITDYEEYEKFKALKMDIKLNETSINGAILELSYIDNYNNDSVDILFTNIFDVDMDNIRKLVRNSKVGSVLSSDTNACYCVFKNLMRRYDILQNRVTGNWNIIRSRPDKLYPNSFNTANKVSLSMFGERITQETLINSFLSICN